MEAEEPGWTNRFALPRPGRTGGKVPERPHLYPVGDLWYLLIAEGGTERGTPSPLPAAPRPPGRSSPARRTRCSPGGTDSPVQNTGHADLVQRPDGSWVVDGWPRLLADRPRPRPGVGRPRVRGSPAGAPVRRGPRGRRGPGGGGRRAVAAHRRLPPPRPGGRGRPGARGGPGRSPALGARRGAGGRGSGRRPGRFAPPRGRDTSPPPRSRPTCSSPGSSARTAGSPSSAGWTAGTCPPRSRAA
ncbi:family 43 glycosylhydrolase [Geodermatophilus sp. CPCC 205761]|uniref:family 43 glycosylhydrolase n=1 Tax=Geodermatophilus sp. CPCC 205761 TaxID=2936597 RepID=UPI003F5374F5